MVSLDIQVEDLPGFCHVVDAELVLEVAYLVDYAVPGVAASISDAVGIRVEMIAHPALLTIICILPFPNSAVLLTSVLRYSASSISPGTAIAFRQTC